MMKISSRAAVTAFASLLLMSSAFAQATAPATPAPAAKAAPAEKKAEKPRTEASLEINNKLQDLRGQDLILLIAGARNLKAGQLIRCASH